VYDEVIHNLPAPSLLVYLRATVPTLMERIRRRSRNIETGITSEYLSLLGSFYDEWMDRFDLCPVLTIPSDELDFVTYEQHLTIIADRVLDRLKGKEVISFQ
jgi:deoxyadenosine/deoxycytidine kinase